MPKDLGMGPTAILTLRGQCPPLGRAAVVVRGSTRLLRSKLREGGFGEIHAVHVSGSSSWKRNLRFIAEFKNCDCLFGIIPHAVWRWVIELGLHRSFKILAPVSSLRRRVAYSLAVVRLVLVPVIFLAVYYLFRMGLIVDRIVNVDAPVATFAEQASVQMLDARRAERSYFLIRDPEYLQANQVALTQVKKIMGKIRSLASGEERPTEEALENVKRYEQQFADAVSLAGKPGGTPVERVQEVVRAYEKDLNDLLKQARSKTRTQLIDNLRSQVGSFDAQITSTIEAGDPTLRRVTPTLQASSQQVLQIASDMETRGWTRVQHDHDEARHLLYRAEWVLSIVSGLTLVLSVWISFVLPRQVVKPLLELREAVDHAASGNYLIDFELRGEGEIVELAKSVRALITHIRQTVFGTQPVSDQRTGEATVNEVYR